MLSKLESTIKKELPSLEFNLIPGTDLIYTRNAHGPRLEALNTGNTLRLGYYGLVNSEDIGGRDVEKLLPCLQAEHQITSILANNSVIDDAGAILIANFLKNNTSLRVLDIHASQISEDGLLAIIDALKSNDSLEYLNIRANKITNKVLESLSLTLQHHNTRLKQIELTQNIDPAEKALNQGLLTKIYEQLPINLETRKKEEQERQIALIAIDAESQKDGELEKRLPKEVIGVISSYFRSPPQSKSGEPKEDASPRVGPK
ncbi:hypothetical protein [Legionella cherrii]|uniref:Ran GTPase-activating protein (RanGAP) involved in mRNA processing and transport n=1 Tax=Legionella cherrii TaxID=28084 RepID=A0A0W0SG92_9GAMM|nr:hypothetical protein [Legionella cherrii]KTC82483.1 hypothetical protein Lche_0747 [Legionella cherrii]VEB39389.1 Ran GTPase-activating protein (RanGAP) involved in mRNA processing and transport [Legionella cherrii]